MIKRATIFKVFKDIDTCKEYDKLLEKEIHRLDRLQRTDSGIRKQQAIPKLKQLQEDNRKEFDKLVPLVKEWVKNLPQDEQWVSEILIQHYCDFAAPTNTLQKVINKKYDMTASNFRKHLDDLIMDSLLK